MTRPEPVRGFWALVAMVVCLTVLSGGMAHAALTVELTYPQSDSQGHYMPVKTAQWLIVTGLVTGAGKAESVTVNEVPAALMPGTPTAFKTYLALEPSTVIRVVVKEEGGGGGDASFVPDRAATLAALEAEGGPNNARGQYRLGNARRDWGDVKAAVRQYRQALKLEPGVAEFHVALGNVYHTQALIEQLGARPKPGAIGPADYGLHFHVGSYLCDDLAAHESSRAAVGRAQRWLERAEAEYREAIKLEAANLAAHLNLGPVLCRRNRPEEGLEVVRRAVDLAPGDFEAHFRFGCMLRRRGQTDDAISEQRRAIDLRESFGPAHGCRARALYLKGDLAAAWEEVHLARKYGTSLPEDFVESLRKKMPEP